MSFESDYELDVAQILEPAFYEKEAHELACDLLGTHLVRSVDGEVMVGRIVEVEVYGGTDDPSCHADSGVPTERTRSMYGEPGTAYVYTIYGMYQCLNVVGPRGPTGKVSAILIRALEPVAGLEAMARRRKMEVETELTRRQLLNLSSGPGKLCQAMDIGPALDGVLLDRPRLCLVHGETIAPERIAATPRIGLNPKTCGASTHFEWRYVVADSKFLSRALKNRPAPS